MVVATTIANGTLVTPTGMFDGGVAIDDGQIVAIGDERTLPDAERTIDASDCLVFPGVVDPHVHIDDHVSIDTYETATKAAALGGVTTVIDFGWQAYGGPSSPWDQPGSLTEGIERKKEKGANAAIDFSLHGGILRESEALFSEIPSLVESGITSFKLYSTYDFGLSNGYARRVFEAVANEDGVAVGHTEDDSVCRALTEQLRENDATAPERLADARPGYAEAMAADDYARLATATGVKYYGFHTAAGSAANALARYHDDGSQIRGEACVHHTTLTRETHAERGNLAKLTPPLRTTEDIDTLFEQLTGGVLKVVSTDHVAQLSERKERTEWWEDPFGANGLQRSLTVFHDEAVNRRGLSYPFLVRTMCTNPARTFGLSQKGTLEPGTDADIVVFDPNETHTIDATDNASHADYSLYDGRTVTGRVQTTLLRGTVVAENGEIVTPTAGQFLKRDRPTWEA